MTLSQAGREDAVLENVKKVSVSGAWLHLIYMDNSEGYIPAHSVDSVEVA